MVFSHVLPDVQPGYLQPLIPCETPEKGESWHDVMKDLDRVVMPGVSHNVIYYFIAFIAAIKTALITNINIEQVI